jgi:hypothetical protein
MPILKQIYLQMMQQGGFATDSINMHQKLLLLADKPTRGSGRLDAIATT